MTAHQHEVDHTFLVHAWAEILMISAREASPNTMMKVHHARHAIKPEPVEMILLNPKSQITQQEPKDLMRAVIEETAVPKLVTPPGTFVEVAMVGAIEEVEPIEDVLTRVGVNDVEKDSYAHAVGSVNELLELVGGTVARASREKTIDLVSERYKRIFSPGKLEC